MPRLGLAGAIGALLFAGPVAGGPRAPAPRGAAPAPAISATAAPVHEEILPNGLHVLLVEDHSKPLVGVCIFVKGGSRTEPPSLSGLSHYYEHLIFRGGSAKQAELEYRREMQRIGEETGSTTNDYTCYKFTSPSQNIDEALWRSVDAWMNLKLTQAKVARERQVVMEEYNQGEDRPDYKVYYQIERLMFRDHPYKRDTIGLKDVIEHASLQTFRTFYEERYVPNQMILAAVGDFKSAEMSEKLRRAFAPYRRGHDGFELGQTEGPQSEFRMGVESMKTPNTRTYLGFHVPPYSDPDAPALAVLAAVLGQGTSSRLYRALKGKENLVSSVSADFEVRRDPGMFLISTEMPPESESRVFGIVRDELRRVATEPVLAMELSRVKSSLLHAYEFKAQTFLDRAERLCLFGVMSDASLEALWPKLLDSVTADDLRRVAARYLAADLASYSVVRPEGVTGPKAEEIEAMLPAWRTGWPAVAASQGPGVGPVRREVLPNGLTLLLKEDHATPVVAVTTVARGGQWIEPEGLAGVSNMAATLLRRGAGSMSARDISDRADALGMRLATNGTADYASIAWQAPSSNFEKAWEIYREVALRPTFPASEVAKVREDLTRQVKSLGDRPFDFTNLEFAKVLYKNSPYRRPLIGDEASLAKIQTPDLRKAYEAMFCGSNMVVAIVGDFDADRTLELARRSLAALRRGAAISVGEVRDDPAREKRPSLIAKEQEQVTYNTGWLACSVRDPDYVPLRLATALIGDKVFFKYVYEKGVAYRSWFYMSDRMGQSSAQNEMGVTPANFAMASTGVLQDIDETFRAALPEGELKRSADKLLSRWYLGAQRSDQVAARLSYFESAGLGYAYVDRYPDLVRKVSSREVLDVARKYFKPDTWTRVAVGKDPAKAAGSSSAPGR